MKAQESIKQTAANDLAPVEGANGQPPAEKKRAQPKMDLQHQEDGILTIAISGAYSTASDRLFQQHPTSRSTIIRPVGGSGLRQSLHG